LIEVDNSADSADSDTSSSEEEELPRNQPAKRSRPTKEETSEAAPTNPAFPKPSHAQSFEVSMPPQDSLTKWVQASHDLLNDQESLNSVACLTTSQEAFRLIRPLTELLTTHNRQIALSLFDSLGDDTIEAMLEARKARKARHLQPEMNPSRKKLFPGQRVPTPGRTSSVPMI
jgi:hypothetical protein